MRELVLPEYTGPITRGNGAPLIDSDSNLIRKTSWSERGFGIVKFLDDSSFQRFRGSLESLVFKRLREKGLAAPADARLERYHDYVQNNEEVHRYAAKWGLPIGLLDLDRKHLCEYFSDVCKVKLRLKPIDLFEGDGPEEIFGYRVIRPRNNDHNPFHRDGWLDVWKHTMNVWIPIAGCDGQSSLQVVPGSHMWSESDIERTPSGAEVYGKRYNVPAVVAVHKPFTPVTPNPKTSEALMFSPYLIHGRGENHNLETTRVSVELRFEEVAD